jgi:hypothetical protein
VTSFYKVRAYCGEKDCDYIHEKDILDAINHESAVSNALYLNEIKGGVNCPLCGSKLRYYPFAYCSDLVEL